MLKWHVGNVRDVYVDVLTVPCFHINVVFLFVVVFSTEIYLTKQIFISKTLNNGIKIRTWGEFVCLIVVLLLVSWILVVVVF